jgi:hypothetical protein
MTRILFAPFSILAGLIAGALGKKLFERVWSLIEDSEAPSPEHREIEVWKLIATRADAGQAALGLPNKVSLTLL